MLLRAGAPSAGLDAMWAARPAARRERDLCSGPAKLCQALGITGADDGADLAAGPVRLVDDGVPRRGGRPGGCGWGSPPPPTGGGAGGWRGIRTSPGGGGSLGGPARWSRRGCR